MIIEENEYSGNFSDVREFYVYYHRKESDDEVFYVGKGKGRRARSKSSRNKYWKHVVEKHGYYVEIVKDGLTEAEAFKLELEMISLHDSDKLVNLTIGGHTTTGYVHSDDSKEAMSIATKNRIADCPEYAKMISDNLASMHDKQRNVPEYRARIHAAQKLAYDNLSEEDRLIVIEGKIAWTRDKEKVAAALSKRKETLKNNPEIQKSTSAKVAALWENPEYRQSRMDSILSVPFEVRKAHLDSIRVQNKWIVNGKFYFESSVSCCQVVGVEQSTLMRSIIRFEEMFDVDFAIVNGYLLEVFDDVKHQSFDVSSEIDPLFNGLKFLQNPLTRSDGRVYFTGTEAALDLPKKVNNPSSTAEWILKLAKGHNGQKGLGFSWRFSSREDIIKLVEDRLREDEQ